MITVEDIKRMRDEINKGLPTSQQAPNIEEGTETHYFFNGPQFYGYVPKEKWDNLMKEAIERMYPPTK
jgi:hypothetical protein